MKNFSKEVTKSFRDQVTIVTAFFDIGSFFKGSKTTTFGPSLYVGWMKIFSVIETPVILYVDNKTYGSYFKKIRSNFPSNYTQIIQISRKHMWSFGLTERISKIYKKPGYPAFVPNTVIPEYSAAMHAKYEVMQKSIEENPFRTLYFAWLDIGYFRGHAYSKKPQEQNYFSIYIPNGFNQSAVAYNVIKDRVASLRVNDIINTNAVWVGGGFFIGRWDVMLNWTLEYRLGLEQMLKQDYMSTDQQVIYYMYNCLTPRTQLQLYKSDGTVKDYWFYLGYLSRKVKTKQLIANTTKSPVK